MLKAILAALFFASPLLAQDQAATALAVAGCGPDQIQFDVKTDKNQHPSAQPESGKALVYVFNVVADMGSTTMRVGLDGAWLGANHGQSYFFFSVDPGNHHLCTNWQSTFKRISKLGSAANLSAEAGRVYYFRTKAYQLEQHKAAVILEPVDSAEGAFLIASSSLSSFHPRK
jgi:hypothetical protein